MKLKVLTLVTVALAIGFCLRPFAHAEPTTAEIQSIAKPTPAFQEGYRQGYRDAYQDAYRTAYREGHHDGYALGFKEGNAGSLK